MFLKYSSFLGTVFLEHNNTTFYPLCFDGEDPYWTEPLDKKKLNMRKRIQQLKEFQILEKNCYDSSF